MNSPLDGVPGGISLVQQLLVHAAGWPLPSRLALLLVPLRSQSHATVATVVVVGTAMVDVVVVEAAEVDVVVAVVVEVEEVVVVLDDDVEVVVASVVVVVLRVVVVVDVVRVVDVVLVVPTLSTVFCGSTRATTVDRLTVFSVDVLPLASGQVTLKSTFLWVGLVAGTLVTVQLRE